MFRSFIYANTQKIYEYYSLLDESVKEVKVSKEATKSHEGGLAVKGVGLKATSSVIQHSEINSYFLSDFDKFEGELLKLDGVNFFDLDENQDYYVGTLPRMAIGKLRSVFEVPEEFDFVNLINMFKPMLMKQVEVEESQQDIFDAFLSNTKADIPIVFEFDNRIVTGKLDTRFLKESYEQLEDYFDEEVTILFKVISHNSSNKEVTIFNPLRDFIKLNRTMRRNGGIGSTNEFSEITVKGPLVKIEILAIYK